MSQIVLPPKASSSSSSRSSSLISVKSALSSPLGLAVAGVAVAVAAGCWFLAPWVKNFLNGTPTTTSIQRGAGKERDLLDYVLAKATKGDPKSVVDTIDAFCWSSNRMMHVGDEKGAIVTELIKKKNPKVRLYSTWKACRT